MKFKSQFAMQIESIIQTFKETYHEQMQCNTKEELE